MHQTCAWTEWVEPGEWATCNRAGTHGDLRWPTVRWCREHASATDELLIRPSPVSSTAPPLQRWGTDET